MSIDHAIRRVQELFPFPGYVRSTNGSYADIAATVMRHLPRGAQVLDFAAGPADITAVVQLLGYRCTAADQLGDFWHSEGDNRQRILRFAENLGIRYVLADGGPLPLEPGSFDMLMVNDLLQHLHDPPRTLFQDLLRFVKPRGYLLATVTNAANVRKRLAVLRGRTNMPPYEQYFWSPSPYRGVVRDYVRGDLVRLAEYLDLEVVELRGCHYRLEKVPRLALPAYKALTAVFTGWRDSWLLCARKREPWKPVTQPPPGPADIWTYNPANGVPPGGVPM